MRNVAKEWTASLNLIVGQYTTLMKTAIEEYCDAM